MDNKKRVLFLVEDISFTFDNRVIRETQALIEEGWDVTVVCPKDPRDPFYRRVSDRLRVYFYPKKDTCSALGHILEHSITILSTFVLAFYAVIRYRCRVIHGCNPMDIFWIPSLPYKLFGVRYIFDHHDLSPELYLCRGEGSDKSLFYRILLWLEKMSFKSANVVISTNESYKRIAIERGGKKSADVFVVRNGPDLDKFRPVPARTGLKNEGEILVGYLGNMNPQDGADYLLRAAKEIVICGKLEHIKFVFVGRGSYQATLAKQSIEMGLKDNVVFTGRLPDDEMLGVMCACDICVQPDPWSPLNDKSTMNKIMEYMALEKPVIAFDLKETRVSCGDAAIYATPNSETDLAEKIVSLAGKPEVRREMGKRGRARVEKELAWRYSVPELLAAYEQALS
ncbi:MAG: glycosyltransferase family 4 protein [Planctomycetota bacterium]|jgi:glycosyltransferase involved in cell wall biosynthesis